MTVLMPAPRRAPTEVIWGENAPVEHSVQIYSDEGLLVDALEGFASGALRAGEGVIILATAAHRRALERRLRTRGYELDRARQDGRYIDVDAAEALQEFMVNGWPADERFKTFVTRLITRARGDGRRVRAFGEMVGLLWDQGRERATMRLEHLWNAMFESEALCLYCAYPRSCFRHADGDALVEICSHHTRQIPE